METGATEMSNPKGEASLVVANKSYATSGAYREQVEQSEQTQKCVFCADWFRNNTDRPILQRVVVGDAEWFARERDPLKITKKEGRYPRLWLLLIKEKHGLDFTEDDAIALYRLERWAEQQFNIPRAYATGQRMGPGAGMVIVHGLRHLIVPETKIVRGKEKLDPYYFPVG